MRLGSCGRQAKGCEEDMCAGILVDVLILEAKHPWVYECVSRACEQTSGILGMLVHFTADLTKQSIDALPRQHGHYQWFLGKP